jgi:hypothetical protein
LIVRGGRMEVLQGVREGWVVCSSGVLEKCLGCGGKEMSCLNDVLQAVSQSWLFVGGSGKGRMDCLFE